MAHDLKVMWDDVTGLEESISLEELRQCVGHIDIRAGCTVLHSHCGVDMK